MSRIIKPRGREAFKVEINVDVNGEAIMTVSDLINPNTAVNGLYVAKLLMNCAGGAIGAVLEATQRGQRNNGKPTDTPPQT